MVKQLLMLDVGCGFNCQPGFVGMDRRQVPGVQIVHDAEDIPWPLDDESCAVVVMSHLIEHIKPWLSIDVINECWRVLEEGGSLMIATPYATSFGYHQDPTHCNPWNEATPTYFMPGQPLYEIYRPKPWHITQLAWAPQGNIELAMKKIAENGIPHQDK
jgi:predicted SAM-dependent methyltransferase